MFSLHDIDETFTCSFEYETFSMAMHCFIENATKYVKPYSKVVAYTDCEERKLIFEMESIRIEKEEVDRLYERGSFGMNVPEDLRGSGIGMYQIKKALARSKIKDSIVSKLNEQSELQGVRYTKNSFTFELPS